MKPVVAPQEEVVVKQKSFLLRYKKPIIITISVIVLQICFGFDIKFCLMNLIWLMV